MATSKGHKDQCRAGHRSTRPQSEEGSEDNLHTNPNPRLSTRLTVFTRLVPVDDIRYTDLTVVSLSLVPISIHYGHALR